MLSSDDFIHGTEPKKTKSSSPYNNIKHCQNNLSEPQLAPLASSQATSWEKPSADEHRKDRELNVLKHFMGGSAMPKNRSPPYDSHKGPQSCSSTQTCLIQRCSRGDELINDTHLTDTPMNGISMEWFSHQSNLEIHFGNQTWQTNTARPTLDEPPRNDDEDVLHSSPKPSFKCHSATGLECPKSHAFFFGDFSAGSIPDSSVQDTNMLLPNLYSNRDNKSKNISPSELEKLLNENYLVENDEKTMALINQIKIFRIQPINASNVVSNTSIASSLHIDFDEILAPNEKLESQLLHSQELRDDLYNRSFNDSDDEQPERNCETTPEGSFRFQTPGITDGLRPDSPCDERAISRSSRVSSRYYTPAEGLLDEQEETHFGNVLISTSDSQSIYDDQDVSVPIPRTIISVLNNSCHSDISEKESFVHLKCLQPDAKVSICSANLKAIKSEVVVIKRDVLSLSLPLSGYAVHRIPVAKAVSCGGLFESSYLTEESLQQVETHREVKCDLEREGFEIGPKLKIHTNPAISTPEFILAVCQQENEMYESMYKHYLINRSTMLTRNSCTDAEATTSSNNDGNKSTKPWPSQDNEGSGTRQDNTKPHVNMEEAMDAIYVGPVVYYNPQAFPQALKFAQTNKENTINNIDDNTTSNNNPNNNSNKNKNSNANEMRSRDNAGHSSFSKNSSQQIDSDRPNGFMGQSYNLNNNKFVTNVTKSTKLKIKDNVFDGNKPTESSSGTTSKVRCQLNHLNRLSNDYSFLCNHAVCQGLMKPSQAKADSAIHRTASSSRAGSVPQLQLNVMETDAHQQHLRYNALMGDSSAGLYSSRPDFSHFPDPNGVGLLEYNNLLYRNDASYFYNSSSYSSIPIVIPTNPTYIHWGSPSAHGNNYLNSHKDFPQYYPLAANSFNNTYEARNAELYNDSGPTHYYESSRVADNSKSLNYDHHNLIRNNCPPQLQESHIYQRSNRIPSSHHHYPNQLELDRSFHRRFSGPRRHFHDRPQQNNFPSNTDNSHRGARFDNTEMRHFDPIRRDSVLDRGQGPTTTFKKDAIVFRLKNYTNNTNSINNNYHNDNING